MVRAILDTDTLSYIHNQRHPEVNAVSRQYFRVFGYFTVTSVSVSEVVEGLEAINDYTQLTNFLTTCEEFEVLSLGMEEAIIAGKILGALRKAGQRIGEQDPYIAAIAISHGLPLVTNNLRHYQRIQDLGFPLELQNWRTA